MKGLPFVYANVDLNWLSDEVKTIKVGFVKTVQKVKVKNKYKK